MISSVGGAEEASRMRVYCAWEKFRELAPILTARRASLKLNVKFTRLVYKACLVYIKNGKYHLLKLDMSSIDPTIESWE
jgi:hypothetical protein